MTQSCLRETSLGAFGVLPDELIIEYILSYLASKDLCKLSQVSRFLHVFSRNDLLWRRLFFADRNRKKTRIVYRGNWLLTYLFPDPEHDAACAAHPLVTQPAQVQGVMSDYLHRQWVRSTMFFGHFYPPPSLPPVHTISQKRPVNLTIPVEDYQSLDLTTFYQKYAYPKKPVMFRNSGVESWPAWKDWTLDSLTAKYGDTLFRVANIDSDVEPSFELSFKDFLHYLKYNKDQDPLYLFDPRFADTVPEMATAYKVPKYFETDFFSVLEEDDRPPYRWILIGPQRTGASWHIDPSGTSAWNTLLSGHKRWALYPPYMIPPGHDPTSPKRMTSVEWYLDIYPFLHPDMRPLEIVQHPGQTIYVPSGWWHLVLNMDDTVAVTQNFADETNIMEVKHALLADKSETTQLHRWEVLTREIPKRWPDLTPVMVASPDELLLAKLQQQSSWIDPNAAELSLEWQQRAKQVFTPFADGSDLGNITQIHAGQNMCFLSKVGFVKFFMPSHDGHTSFVSEVKANQILLASAEQKVQDCAYLLSIPRMLKYGYFLDAQQVKISDWRWPYIITEVENPSKTNIPSAVPLKSTPAASLVSASDFMPEDESGYEILLSPILNSLRYLHTLDRALLEKLPDLQPYDSTRRSTSYLANCLESATLNHLRWRVFPKHLLELLPKYLPKDAAEVFDPITYGHITATLIHGDINPSNILGYLDEDGNEDEDEVRDRDEPDEVKEHEAQAYGRAPLFRPTSLIDFGDAVFESDPLIDIISVFITIVDCQQDKKLCSRLLDYWRELTKSSSYSGSAGTKLARRCMWHVLLWPGDGLSTHLVRCMPEIGTMLTWEQVEEEVFGWWKDAHVEG